MGLGGVCGAGPEGPPNITEGAGQAHTLTGCLRPIHKYHIANGAVLQRGRRQPESAEGGAVEEA